MNADLKPAEKQKVEAASHFAEGALLLERADREEGMTPAEVLKKLQDFGIEKNIGRYALWRLIDTGVVTPTFDQLVLVDPPS